VRRTNVSFSSRRPSHPRESVVARGRTRLYSAQFAGPGVRTSAATSATDESRRRAGGEGATALHDEARGAPGGRKAAGIFTVLRQEERFMQLSQKHQEYWNKNLRITAVLLVIWFFVTFVLGYFARELSFNFFGWPFAFWVGAQGALVVYVLIIWFYARYMNNLDREYDVHEGDE
jgi:putative solute:sodium symporter small subunit